MTDLGPAISGSSGAGLANHAIELAPRDGAPKDRMQSTAAPAASAAVLEAFDPLPQLAEVQGADLLGTASTYRRLPPTQPPPPAAERRSAKPYLRYESADRKRIPALGFGDHGDHPPDALIFFPPGPCRA